MTFVRIKTIRKNGRVYRYYYLQRSVRIGKKVKSIMRFIGAVGSEVIHGSKFKGVPESFKPASEGVGEKFQREFLKETEKPT